MRKWEDLSKEEQVYLYWQYSSDLNLRKDDEPISFSEFSEMMKGFTFK